MNAINVKSEIAPLKKVLLHRPGNELLNLTPDSLTRLLFDDIPFLPDAQKEHDEFANILKSNDIEVVYLEDLMAEVLEMGDRIEDQFIRQFIYEAGIRTPKYKTLVFDYLKSFKDKKELVLKTMEGIKIFEISRAKREVEKSLVDLVSEESDFLADPMPNLYFTRDPFASAGHGVILNKMYSVTRCRETIYAEYIFKYHPDYRVEKLYDRYLPYHIEGGDVLNLNEHVLAVGISQRTEAGAIDQLAKNIFKNKNSQIDTILAFNIPNSRAFMHLDTVFTQIDYDKFTYHPGIMETLQVFEITEGKSFSDKNILGKGLNKVDSLLSFMLDAGDRTFYEATFTNSINNQLKLNNTTEVTQDMVDIATTEALSRTWQDNNGYTKFVLNIRKGLNALNIGGYGLGDVLIPFAKTPANLTKAIIDYSPAGMIKAINEGVNLNRSLSNGQYNAQLQHQFVQDLGKATIGTMLYILGYALAKAGITTGESDDDKDIANFMKNTLGVSSYSIKIGNKSFTYDWAQPVAAPLAITANIVQKQKDGASLKENIISSLDTAGNILLEQSFLESISTVLNNNEGIATGIQEAIFELPSRAIPTVFKQIADLIDPVQRQSFEKDKPLETAMNKIKAKVPILSKTLAPSVDTMGRDIKKYGGKNNIFNVFLNPANVNTENISKSAAEIYRLYKSTGETNIMPRVAPYYINQNGEKETPVIIHRTIYGSLERFIGILIEHFGGAFPTWLAPVQVKVLPVNNEYHLEYCKKITEKLNDLNIRAELDARDEKLGYRMREAQTKKVPFQLVLGDNETNNNLITYRRFGSKDSTTVSVDEFIELLVDEIKTLKRA